MKNKLKSRKFWAMIAGVVVGTATAFGLDENIITSTAGIVTAVSSVITYIAVEGKIDKASVDKLIKEITKGDGE